ncbi:hypothetical protein DEDGFLLK_00084 [Lactiplantibacillus phage Gut-P1]|nr:hypothetical protein DEDGFLLK_00084 [Lactiplantibacillus phage Gut-P1]
MNKNTLVASAAVIAGLALGVQTVSADTVTVQAGDTVSEIAHEHGVSVSDVVNENSLSNPNLIFVGDKLEVNGNASTANQATKVSVQVPAVKTEQPAKEQTQPTVTGNKAVNYSSAESQTQSVQPQQSSQSSQSSVMSKTSGQLSQSEINQVAEEMASRTGQSSSTWSAIINRESKGNVNISNSEGSGAYGLLQLMRSSHGSVSSQVDEAVQLYKAQGMNAWSQTAY